MRARFRHDSRMFSDSAVARPASGHQVFTRQQALQAGYTKAAIEHRLLRHHWLALHDGVYITREDLDFCGDSTVQRHVVHVAAATLALDTTAVASHQSAALIHELTLLSQLPGVTLTRSRTCGSTRSGPDHVQVRTSRLPDTHVRHRYGIGVTSPARTAIDLARTRSFREGVVIADAAMRVARVTRMELKRVLKECSGAPGIRQARDVVAFADPRNESVLESLARVLFAEYGLPVPQTQVFLGEDGPIGRVDFYWEGYGVVGEADGMSKYTSRHTLVAEKLRQEFLENAGFAVVRFTWEDVVRRPEQTIGRIRRAFERATARPQA